MMLRSSSTSVLGSLLSSYSESPNNNFPEINTIKHSPITLHNPNKLPSQHSGSLHLTSSWSCHSSPISPSVAESYKSKSKLRRAQSDGNLIALGSTTCNSNDEFDNSIPPKKFSIKPNNLLLETIPSFSFHHSRDLYEEQEEEDSCKEEEKEVLGENDERFVAMENAKFSVEKRVAYMNETDSLSVDKETGDCVSKMHLAMGLGVSIGGFGSGGDSSNNGYKPTGSDDGGEEGATVEEYYKRMVDENPGNPLFLRNYAQFLYQSKKNLQGAEDYFSRAILADPKDGEIMSQYAKLVWELHQDHERALCYFERAAQAAPEDSNVLAAYANFLWETEEDEDDEANNLIQSIPPRLHNGVIATANI
ncbi:hypothetical protein Ancab_021994 [Ancistrocladus abbreviatus]